MSQKPEVRRRPPSLFLIGALGLMAFLAAIGMIFAIVNDGGPGLVLTQILAVVVCAGGAVFGATKRKQGQTST